MKKVFNLLNQSSRDLFYDWITQQLVNETKLTVTVEKYRKKRSLTANAYYWSVCIPSLGEHFGYTTDDMHTMVLGTYVGWEQRNFRGQILYVPRRTSTTPETMDTMDFQGLIQTAQQLAAEEGLILPDQEEQSATKNNP